MVDFDPKEHHVKEGPPIPRIHPDITFRAISNQDSHIEIVPARYIPLDGNIAPSKEWEFSIFIRASKEKINRFAAFFDLESHLS